LDHLINPYTQIFLPIAVVLVMFALGTTLTIADLRGVLRRPRGLLVGLFAHTLLLPLLAFLLAFALDFPPEMAIGLVLIAACPANPSVNLFSFLARGDTMLSVTMTALASLICVISLPFFLNLAFRFFPAGHDELAFPVLPAALGLFLVSTLPVMGGMWLRHRRARTAQAIEAHMNRFGMAMIALIVIGAIWTAQSDILGALRQMGGAALLLNASSVALALTLARLTRLSRMQCLSIGFEAGLQNFALAALVSLTLLHAPALLLPAIAYGLTMWLSAFTLLLLARRASFDRHGAGTTSSPSP
jgi:BASS family bile acid:Na+ symporter